MQGQISFELNRTRYFSYDDIPDFEHAFDKESLRNFYKQETNCFRTHAKSFDNPIFEESSPLSDDRDTQASPSLLYRPKYSQRPSLMDNQFSINLSQQLFSDDVDSTSSPKSFFDLSKDTHEVPQIRSFDDFTSTTQMLEEKRMPSLQETLKTPSMPSMPSLSFSSMLHHQPSQVLNKQYSEPMSAFDEETLRLMRLVKTKKVFKLQKDTKPRSPTKQKGSPKLKSKATPPQQQAAPQIALTPVSMNVPTFVGQPQEGNPNPVIQYVQALNQQGMVPPKILEQLKMMMQQNQGNMPMAPMRQASFPQKN